MDAAIRCRTQAEKCHRLMLLSQSGAEATILTGLTRSWNMIANQTDRYVAIKKREAAQSGKAASVGGLSGGRSDRVTSRKKKQTAPAQG
jgi:hypothetical protein